MTTRLKFRLLLTFVFLESAASVLIQRSLYFFTHDRLQFSDRQNLLLALGAGVLYVLGALPSHRLARALGQRRAVLVLLAAQAAVLVGVTLIGRPWAVVALAMVFAGLLGAMWPMVESFASAGYSPSQTQRIVGYYNMAWSTALPVGLLIAGWLIQSLGFRLFLVPAVVAVVGGGLILSQPAEPTHQAHDHPDRPTPLQARTLRGLMLSSRWSMIASYALSFVLTPLLPGIFTRLGYGVIAATMLASVLDSGRPVAFLCMLLTPRWHGRRDLLALAAVALPVGFLMVLAGGSWGGGSGVSSGVNSGGGIGLVLGGELLFGLAAGVAYYAALYYAMVVGNASVDAGGAHEALIGSGFAGGPLCALVGQWLGGTIGQVMLGVALGVGPLMALCLGGGLWPLVPRRAQPSRPGTG